MERNSSIHPLRNNSSMIEGMLMSTIRSTIESILDSNDGQVSDENGFMSTDDQSGLRLPLYLRCTATTICILLLMIGIPGNILVPYVVLRNKDLRNSTNIFLINLSISDILVLIISTPTVLIELHSQPEVWFLGSFVCKNPFLFSVFSLTFFFFPLSRSIFLHYLFSLSTNHCN